MSTSAEVKWTRTSFYHVRGNIIKAPVGQILLGRVLLPDGGTGLGFFIIKFDNLSYFSARSFCAVRVSNIWGIEARPPIVSLRYLSLHGTALYVFLRSLPLKYCGHFWGQHPWKEHIPSPILEILCTVESSKSGPNCCRTGPVRNYGIDIFAPCGSAHLGCCAPHLFSLCFTSPDLAREIFCRRAIW